MKKTTAELINREVDTCSAKLSKLREKRDQLNIIKKLYTGKQEQEILDIVSDLFDDYISTVSNTKNVYNAIVVNESSNDSENKE